ncbi:hypothetical protein H2200_002117 [Cladophialophora chaetospira]|uniref:Heterokaryon incompatibility domain-containing protein n=1 Tax=Cladophialophora chaetospira TaxID=386627 RepID=A0AA38XID1_9EURO|nr:hypothetical protein H2200_002117 [Cladophialophora chaetospira]
MPPIRFPDVNSYELVNVDKIGQKYEYAILSHRWEHEEVLYDDMLGDVGTRNRMYGWRKVQQACHQARRDNFRYIWIDTLCIDKKSSSELSEAINSMFAWYKDASRCYAYLWDVPAAIEPETSTKFASSEWFTRAWTLQELIAPKELVFFAPSEDGWSVLGWRHKLCRRLSEITKIDNVVLSGTKSVHTVSVAKRMSWVARRKSERTEDRAYSLLGLFDVNMPMIYGEGPKAFLRLQEKIMEDSDDESLFAWRANPTPTPNMGLLAPLPEMFEDSGNYFSYSDWEPRVPFFKTNRGLQISLPLRRVEGDLYLAALNCPRPGKSDGFVGIYLERDTDFDDTEVINQFVRVRADELLSLDNASARGRVQTIRVRQTPAPFASTGIFPEHYIQIQRGPAPVTGCKLLGTMGDEATANIAQKVRWIPEDVPTLFNITKDDERLSCVLVFERDSNGTKFALLLGSTSNLDGVIVRFLGEWEDRYKFGDLELMFEHLQPFTDPDTGFELVHVKIVSAVKADVKIFYVSVNVEQHPSMMDIMINDTPLRHVVPPIPAIAAKKRSRDRTRGIWNLLKRDSHHSIQPQ